MKLKVKQSLIYCGMVYNPGEVVDILESDIIERVKSLELVEAEEVTEEVAEEVENLEEVAEEVENLEEVEETNKNSKKSKKA
nr:MAG TPA: C2H2 type zinc-finger protein [Caudoviricetes sp.]